MDIYEGHPESKECLRIQSAHLFCCSRALVSDVQCDVESCLMQLYLDLARGKCRDSRGHGCVDCEPRRRELRGIIRFLQADEVLGYLAEEASSHVELFCCTTMHVRILPANTSLAARAITLGHLGASSVQSGAGTVGLYSVSKNEEAACW